MGNSRHQPLSPTPVSGEMRACVTLGQDKSNDDQLNWIAHLKHYKKINFLKHKL
jgi:hypothetical protein